MIFACDWLSRVTSPVVVTPQGNGNNWLTFRNLNERRTNMFRCAIMALVVLVSTAPMAACQAGPGEITEHQFQALRFLEGRWSGRGPDGKTFYEEYAFPDSTTVRSRRYGDATFASATDSSTVTLRSGQAISRWGEYTWRAIAIGTSGAEFEPVNAPSAFSWGPVGADTIDVTQRWTDENGVAQSYSLQLVRIPPAH